MNLRATEWHKQQRNDINHDNIINSLVKLQLDVCRSQSTVVRLHMMTSLTLRSRSTTYNTSTSHLANDTHIYIYSGKSIPIKNIQILNRCAKWQKSNRVQRTTTHSAALWQWPLTFWTKSMQPNYGRINHGKCTKFVDHGFNRFKLTVYKNRLTDRQITRNTEPSLQSTLLGRQ